MSLKNVKSLNPKLEDMCSGGAEDRHQVDLQRAPKLKTTDLDT